jgi:hypothetical protein
MNISRTQKRFASNPIKTILITRIWAHDGWCYIPEMNIRQRFFEDGKLEMEGWKGIIPLGEHWEHLTYHLYSHFPLAWTEEGPWGHETFEELSSIHSKNNLH